MHHLMRRGGDNNMVGIKPKERRRQIEVSGDKTASQRHKIDAHRAAEEEQIDPDSRRVSLGDPKRSRGGGEYQ